MQIVPADLQDDLAREAVAALIAEYAGSLAEDSAVCVTSLQNELATLGQPGSLYAPPRGQFLIALDEQGEIAAGVGIADLGPEGHPDTAELRRLFVRPAYRNRQLGRWLAMAVLHAAQQMGYTRVRLETAPSMAAAQALYTSLGFRDVASPRHDVRVMELELAGR